MLLKKHGKQEERRAIKINYRSKINLNENKKQTQKIRKKITEDAENSILKTNFIRPSGKYALTKLKYIRKYIWIYATIISKHFPNYSYLETHSGPGLCKIRGTKKITCGTPVLALSNIPCFTRYNFIENDSKCINSLGTIKDIYFPNHNVEIHKGDCNKVINNILSTFQKNSPILTVIDPEGMEIHWNTMKHLSKMKMDIVLMFPFDLAIKRCISPNCDSKSQQAVTKMYGTDEWIKIRDEHYLNRKIKYHIMRKRFVQLYKDRLKDVLDFPQVVVSKIIRGDNNQYLYYVMIAGREEITDKVGKDILEAKTEQTTLY